MRFKNFDLQAAIFKSWQGKNPCYECFFTNSEDYPEESCDQMGILATVAGLGGTIQGQLLINDVLKKKVNFSEIILLSCNEFRNEKN